MGDWRLDLYHTKGQFEWATIYWLIEEPDNPAARAATLAAEEAELVHTTITFNRWELQHLGVKVDEGALSGIIGVDDGQVLPVNYCALVRQTSGGPARPSVRYIHGITEGSMLDGSPSTGFLASLVGYGAALVSNYVADSDGFAVSGVLFRRFSRRKRMRRLA